MTTSFHSRYWAYQLRLQASSGSMESLSRSFSGAKVDLNPHQVDAALFAFRSPLSKGVILADEVGLGKTIEAGLVISQKWAERRKGILLILPATLRKQWAAELEEKFFIPSLVLDASSFNRIRKKRGGNPFLQPASVVICSYQFAALKRKEIKEIPWDLVVIDEAHRLRNVYKDGNVIASAIAGATKDRRKLLLTATPLQNSLLELFGMVSVIDEQVFGGIDSFRDQFMRGGDEEKRNSALKDRLQPICIRTLRKQVLEYISYTERIPITQDFTPSDEEQLLYEKISAYLQRPDLVAIPQGPRALVTLVLRKLLASSTFAIAGALRKMADRLEKKQADLGEDFESFEELAEEWNLARGAAERPPADGASLSAEIQELRSYAQLAAGIQQNAKGTALLAGLDAAFQAATALGAARKAVIFTESRRTQAHLLELLERNGYQGQVVTLNGVNSEPLPRAIFQRWKERHAGQAVLQGSPDVNMKSALVEEFRDHATLLLATEAAAEGVNLQFCSLVVNYDLPWNPQRIEQRIGRCHRYGQKHNVVVVNFLNRRNQADQRVFELLSEKFRLFEGVFGASDEVLGALESGMDLEKRIAQVYQECRTADEIQAAFDQLRSELDEQIQARMQETRTALLENFASDVASKLRVFRDKAQGALEFRQSLLLRLTRAELDGKARFLPEEPGFEVSEGPFRGTYQMDWAMADHTGAEFYREEHPLARELVQAALDRSLPPARLVIAAHGGNEPILEPFRGSRGQLWLVKLQVAALQTEEFLLLAGRTAAGVPLDPEQCEKLLGLPARLEPLEEPLAPMDPGPDLQDQVRQRLEEVTARNDAYFDEEAGKLDAWVDDFRVSHELQLKELDLQVRQAQAARKAAVGAAARREAEKAIKALEGKRNKLRRELFEQQDAIADRRTALIDELESQLTTSHELETIFHLEWELA